MEGLEGAAQVPERTLAGVTGKTQRDALGIMELNVDPGRQLAHPRRSSGQNGRETWNPKYNETRYCGIPSHHRRGIVALPLRLNKSSQALPVSGASATLSLRTAKDTRPCTLTFAVFQVGA